LDGDLLAAMRRHQHDGQGRMLTPNGLDNFESIHAGHLQVGQHHPGRNARDGFHSLVPTLGHRHLVSGDFQHELNHVRLGRTVFNN
jgi:hypothetical protein